MSKIKIEDFHIGFKYEEYQLDCNRYLNKGMIWVEKTYTTNSPRLHKIQERITAGTIRHVQPKTYTKGRTPREQDRRERIKIALAVIALTLGALLTGVVILNELFPE